MKNSRGIWIPIVVLLLWLWFSWHLGSRMGVHVPGLYYLRGGLSILGIAGLAGYFLLRPKTSASGRAGVSTSEMDDNFSEASHRLQTAGIKQMAALPTVFFLGDTDTAKTSVIAKSDIAQLLAGQAQQEVAIIPTTAVNFWLAQNTLFVDPAGALLNDSSNRKRLFKKFSAVALRSVFGARQLPARSVVITVSCDTLLQKGGADALAVIARQFQSVLAELAQEIGSRFPVYVLFTKADKINYFRDFVENLSDQEASDVFGATLPLETSQGVYAQQQNSRVNEAFQQLYYWLVDRRPAYLIREHKPAALPNIYEFPREFNKLRPLLTSFLVDLCRPSQLGISPFLRGFYFTGLRAVTVNDVAPAAYQVPLNEDSGMDSNATRMFTFPARGGSPLVSESRDSSARKIAQWVYLTQLLPSLILADGTAGKSGAGNVKLNVARRFALGVAIAASLCMGLWWSVSYSRNHALVNDALDAAKGAPTASSLDALQRLTTVKNTLETLNYFQEHGRPLSYGGFLYAGDEARQSVSKTYYGLFRRFLLAPTQENLRQTCSPPNTSQSQNYLYDDLKAYLMTTQYHNKSVPEFLTPTLLMHWKAGRAVDAEEERLARLNFDFYSRELLNKNEYWPPTTPDAAALASCRDYLNGLGQTDPIYRRVLADAGAHLKPIVFNDDYPGTEATVVNRYPVEGPFTKPGFDRFQDLLKNPKKYSDVEEWVLEPKSRASLDLGQLSVALEKLYIADFVKVWEAYLEATTVRKPANAADAVAKLDKLTGNRSALLLALCVASENTDVDNKEIRAVFQPVQTVTPPSCKQALVGGAGSAYMAKLVNLHETLKTLDKDKVDTYDAAQRAAVDTETTVKQTALLFNGHTDESVIRMLKAPIYYATAPPSHDANDAAATACDEIRKALTKYPFNPNSREDASMAEVDGFLKKQDGALWKLVAHPAIAPLIVQFGDTFSAKTSGRNQARPSFINFLNKSANLAHVLYGQNGQAAGFRFALSPVPSPDVIEHVTLKINGSIQSTDAHGTPTKEFEWPGNGDGVDLNVKFAGGSEFTIAHHSGIWGIWHFMDSGTEVGPNQFEWVVKVGNETSKTPQGIPILIRFNIDPAKAALLRPHYFSSVCVGKVN